MADSIAEQMNALLARVKEGEEPFTEIERERIAMDRDRVAEGNLRLIQRMNRRGVQVDAGLEAITQFRRFLQDIGVITEDQRLAAEVIWELMFHQQLKFSWSQVQQAQAQQKLATPQSGGLIVPPGH